MDRRSEADMVQSCTVCEGCVWGGGGQLVGTRVRCCSMSRGTDVTAPPAGKTEHLGNFLS